MRPSDSGALRTDPPVKPDIPLRFGAFAVVTLAAAAAQAEPRPRSEVIVTLVGDRADSSGMEKAVETLLGLEGIVVAWERWQGAAGEEFRHADADGSRGSGARRVVVDVTNPTTVSLLLERAGGTQATARVVEAPSLDEATCETIAQILRSVLLAPGAPSVPLTPTPAATVAIASPSSRVPATRRFDLRAGYVVATGGGDLGFLTGPMLAASWATSQRAGSPIVVLSITRSAGTFASAGAPADASLALWSIRVGAGWERSWRTGWRLAVEASVGPDQLRVTPVSNGQTGTFQVSPPQSAVRLGIRMAAREELALLGPVLGFVEAQADLMAKSQVDVQDGSTSRSYVVETASGHAAPPVLL